MFFTQPMKYKYVPFVKIPYCDHDNINTQFFFILNVALINEASQASLKFH